MRLKARLQHRRNVFAAKGTDWALLLETEDRRHQWVVAYWPSRPSEEEVGRIIYALRRGQEMYRTLIIPPEVPMIHDPCVEETEVTR